MDSDLEFCELRALAQSLLHVKNTSTSLSLVEKITLSEHLRYCFYKLVKFSCPKTWSESDFASVKLLEMMQPELKFEVPSERIRHKLCSCISDAEKDANNAKAVELANLMCSSRVADCIPPIIEQNIPQNKSTPLAIEPEIEEGLSDVETSSRSVEQIERVTEPLMSADTIEELETAMLNTSTDDDDDEDVNLPDTVTDVAIVRKLINGDDPPPKLCDFEFAKIASLARLDNFDNPESIMCDSIKENGHRNIRGVACASTSSGQLTLIRPHRRTVMKGYTETKTFSAFFEGIEDSFIDKQDMYEHLCLYYWFKNVIRNKGVHKSNWMEIPTILSRGDNSLKSAALRAIPISYHDFACKMV